MLCFSLPKWVVIAERSIFSVFLPSLQTLILFPRSTMDGPVVTTIRALLTPPPSREMRVKNDYIKHAEIRGAIGVKIVAPDVGRVIAGGKHSVLFYVFCVSSSSILDLIFSIFLFALFNNQALLCW